MPDSQVREDQRERSFEKLGQLLSDFMMADQSGDQPQLPSPEQLVSQLEGIDVQEVRDAFLAVGIVSEGAEILDPEQDISIPTI